MSFKSRQARDSKVARQESEYIQYSRIDKNESIGVLKGFDNDVAVFTTIGSGREFQYHTAILPVSRKWLAGRIVKITHTTAVMPESEAYYQSVKIQEVKIT
jgi:hypothetical protein